MTPYPVQLDDCYRCGGRGITVHMPNYDGSLYIQPKIICHVCRGAGTTVSPLDSSKQSITLGSLSAFLRKKDGYRYIQ